MGFMIKCSPPTCRKWLDRPRETHKKKKKQRKRIIQSTNYTFLEEKKKNTISLSTKNCGMSVCQRFRENGSEDGEGEKTRGESLQRP